MFYDGYGSRSIEGAIIGGIPLYYKPVDCKLPVDYSVKSTPDSGQCFGLANLTKSFCRVIMLATPSLNPPFLDHHETRG